MTPAAVLVAAEPVGHPRIAHAKLPLSFEPNLGQADPRVKFLSRGRGYTLFLTKDEAVVALPSQKAEVRSQNTEVRSPKPEARRRTAPGVGQASVALPQSLATST